MGSYAVVCLDDMRIALPLCCVDSTVRAVQVTRLPAAPEIVLGVVNVRGRIIPVIDMRRRFHLPRREIGLNDRLVIARTSRRPLALVADAVSGIVECADTDFADAGSILPGLGFIEGVGRLDDGLILIHNLDRFLSLEEDDALSRALGTAGDT
ncbi:MAG: purine-binding chemotaxis protein CheW [Rubrivivax sp.]|nr:purine-binding chemotaxis protein CheW [Rubrivivax sp.]